MIFIVGIISNMIWVWLEPGTRRGGREVNLDYLPSVLEQNTSVNRLDIAIYLNFSGEEKTCIFIEIKEQECL